MQRKDLILKLAEKAGVAAMAVTSEKASFWLCHQEQEPEGIREFVKRKVK